MRAFAISHACNLPIITDSLPLLKTEMEAAIQQQCWDMKFEECKGASALSQCTKSLLLYNRATPISSIYAPAMTLQRPSAPSQEVLGSMNNLGLISLTGGNQQVRLLAQKC